MGNRSWAWKAIVGCACLAASASIAQADGLASRHRDWQVFVESVGGDRVCYAVTRATDAVPRDFNHGDATAVIATWRSGAARERPHIDFGYEPRPKGPIRARVGRESWSLYTDGKRAFADDEDDRALVNAMKRGYTLRVEATSAEGERTYYEFSLSGVTAALRDAQRRCQ